MAEKPIEGSGVRTRRPKTAVAKRAGILVSLLLAMSQAPDFVIQVTTLRVDACRAVQTNTSPESTRVTCERGAG